MTLSISNIIAFLVGSFCGAIGILLFSNHKRKHSINYKDETVFTASPLETLTKEEQEKVKALVDKMKGNKPN